MKVKISAVINTLNEAKDLGRALKSLDWVDEIIVVDMESDDDTLKIAKKMGAITYTHPRLSFVEPARDFAINKASGDWILILDPDEVVSSSLAKRLVDLAQNSTADIIRVPRKNLIFNKWMQQSMWWPDYNIRFFKKGSVSWKGVKIHRPPTVQGEILDIEDSEELAITHYHYNTISDFLKRLDRYTSVQAEELHKEGRKFKWNALISEPANEFLSRYFASSGYKDGLHGFALSLLQGFSHLIMILKLWELEKFPEEKLSISDLKVESKKLNRDFDYWVKHVNLSSNVAIRTMQKLKNKVIR